MAEKKGWLSDLLLLALLLGLLFGFHLGQRALWAPDEGRYSEVAREMVATGNYLIPRLNGVKLPTEPILFYWLQSMAIRWFGINEWALRLWPALAAFLGCTAVYFGGRKVFSRRVGQISAVVLATSGLYYAMSRVANPDMVFTALISCSLISFFVGTRETVETRRRCLLLLFYGFAALATLEKGWLGMALPTLIVGSWRALFHEQRELQSMHLASGVLILIVIVLPLPIWLAFSDPQFFDFAFVQALKNPITDGFADYPWSYFPVLLIGLFPWSIFLYQALRGNLAASWRPRHGYREAVFLALWAGWVFVFFSLCDSKTIPYVLPMFPPLAILLARYFVRVWERAAAEGVRAGYWLFLVFVLILAAAGHYGPQHYFERYSNWPLLEVPYEATTLPSTNLLDYPELAHLRPYIIVQTTVLILGALTVLLLGQGKGFSSGFFVLTLTSVLFLVVLDSSLPIFDERRSVKELALAIRPKLERETEVATYHAYYQDLPVYLQHHVTQVGWSEDSARRNTLGHRDDDAGFWQGWDSLQQRIVLTDRTTFEQLRRSQRGNLHLIVKNNYTVAFSNRAQP